MSGQTKILVVLALALLATPTASGSSDPGAPYPTVLPIRQGQQIVVKLHRGFGKPVKGLFVASGAAGVRLQPEHGTQLTVPWESVRKIVPKRRWYEFWIGVGTGAALAGIGVLSSEGDVGAGWGAAVIGAGAGAGAAAAALGGPIDGPIYESPRGESGYKQAPNDAPGSAVE
jgi:hypothetical protein